MENVSGSAEIIAAEVDDDHRYRILKTDRGYLLIARARNEAGVLIPAEWLYRTEEAARAGLAGIMAFHAAWRAALRGWPVDALFEPLEALDAQHTATCERLDDAPIMGREVQRVATLSDSHLLPARQARRGEATRTRVDPRMKHAPPGDGPDLLLIFLLQSAVGRLQVSLHQVAIFQAGARHPTNKIRRIRTWPPKSIAPKGRMRQLNPGQVVNRPARSPSADRSGPRWPA